jgi:transglutaminase-like putative cysteine protease
MNRLRWMGGVVIGASLPHWGHLPLWISASLVVAVAWRLAAERFHLGLPPRLIRFLFAFVAFAGVLFEYRTINGVNAGSALLVVMVALKFLESTRHRDQLVLMMIAYFLVFASLLYQTTIFSAFYLVAFVWITTIGLLQLGRRGALMHWIPTAKLAGKFLLQATPIMIVLFLFFPRLPGPLWAIPGDLTSAASGLSESMSPGDITDLGLSDEVAFRVEFLTPTPTTDRLYWRVLVLSDFLDGRTWTRRRSTYGGSINSIEHVGDAVTYRVMMEAGSPPWAPALEMPESWPQRRVVMRSGYVLTAGFGDRAPTRTDYEVTSYTDYRILERLPPREIDYYRRLPVGYNPRTRALAQSWVDAGLEAEEIVERALDVFRGEDFFYTLTPPALGLHTADEFIFETKEGFCEHYASAFTIMLRAAGIPARVVTGYQGGELNPLGDYYIVRQSDAHAWTEVWLDDRGWVRVDPITAVAPERIALGSLGSGLSGATATGAQLGRFDIVRRLALAWDAVNIYWNEWIVGYGPRLQRSILEALGFERPRWREVFTVGLIGLCVCLLGTALALGWNVRRQRRRDAAQLEFDKFCRRLRRFEVAVPAPAEGPRAYATRATQRLPFAAAEIERIVQTYLRARYERDESGQALDRLRELVRAFRPA